MVIMHHLPHTTEKRQAMEQVFNQNTLDYQLGWNTGVGLAKIDAFLNEQAVWTEAQEQFDHTPLRTILNKWEFVRGVSNGYEAYRDGFV